MKVVKSQQEITGGNRDVWYWSLEAEDAEDFISMTYLVTLKHPKVTLRLEGFKSKHMELGRLVMASPIVIVTDVGKPPASVFEKYKCSGRRTAYYPATDAFIGRIGCLEVGVKFILVDANGIRLWITVESITDNEVKCGVFYSHNFTSNQNLIGTAVYCWDNSIDPPFQEGDVLESEDAMTYNKSVKIEVEFVSCKGLDEVGHENEKD